METVESDSGVRAKPIVNLRLVLVKVLQEVQLARLTRLVTALLNSWSEFLSLPEPSLPSVPSFR